MKSKILMISHLALYNKCHKLRWEITINLKSDKTKLHLEDNRRWKMHLMTWIGAKSSCQPPVMLKMSFQTIRKHFINLNTTNSYSLHKWLVCHITQLNMLMTPIQFIMRTTFQISKLIHLMRICIQWNWYKSIFQILMAITFLKLKVWVAHLCLFKAAKKRMSMPSTYKMLIISKWNCKIN